MNKKELQKLAGIEPTPWHQKAKKKLSDTKEAVFNVSLMIFLIIYAYILRAFGKEVK